MLARFTRVEIYGHDVCDFEDLETGDGCATPDAGPFRAFLVPALGAGWKPPPDRLDAWLQGG